MVNIKNFLMAKGGNYAMGEMKTLRIMSALLEEWTLPDKMTVTWDVDNSQEVAHAGETFRQYLADGWMAFSDDPRGRRQIFQFNPQLERIVLVPPLGGG
ncbi:hypothetical protein AC480_00190 [miscellaneous Crenarchaeota group archaeon SMTZ1-55]|nr:MAG: hypothetical protein AC480_00190 [miscellaneous Crenarchaeota group archaeon SMTZ1-55]